MTAWNRYYGCIETLFTICVDMVRGMRRFEFRARARIDCYGLDRLSSRLISYGLFVFRSLHRSAFDNRRRANNSRKNWLAAHSGYRRIPFLLN